MDGRSFYPTIGDIIALHAQVMERTGAVPTHPRSEAQLEAALMSAQMAAHYKEADLVSQAVILAVDIFQAQAFTEGNKRSTFAAVDVFLLLNGLHLKGKGVDLAKHVERIAPEFTQRYSAVADFEDWLRGHVIDVDP